MGLHDDDSRAKSATPTAGAVLPSNLTPDRKRIDSDVRAFLRQPSTPWITFDKDEPVYRSAASSILTAPNVFPADVPGHEAPKAEPSSFAVASDFLGPEPRDIEGDPIASGGDRFLPVKRSSRIVVGAAATFALVGLATAIAFGTSAPTADESTRSHRAPSTAYATQPSSASTSSPAGADLTPPDLDPKPVATSTSEPAPAVATPPAPAKEQYARLSIAGKARNGFVFLDGKRLLGKGARSFTITCGMHQIAVNERSNVKDVDVPCNGEMVISE